MKLHIKPEQVYIMVFCFFAIGAGCQAVGKYAAERIDGSSSRQVPAREQSSSSHRQSQFWLEQGREAPYLENLSRAEAVGMDMAAGQR